jgi:hypothetical protein
VIEYFGGIKKLAQRLDVWPQAIYEWGDTVPLSVQYKIQVLSNNHFKADDKKNGD